MSDRASKPSPAIQAQRLGAYLAPAARLLPPRADAPSTKPDRDISGGPETVTRYLTEHPAIREYLWSAYLPAPDPPTTAPDPPTSNRLPKAKKTWRATRRAANNTATTPAVVALLVVAATLVLYAVFRRHPTWQAPALSGFAVVLLTLLPGFLYMRFLRFRLGPVRVEYVYNLHRLGVDRAGNLPEPPFGSDAWRRWANDGGQINGEADRIYRSKFETQYGRWPRTAEEKENTPLGSLLSIYLFTAVVGVGWAAAIWHVHAPAQSTPRLDDALRFGFLGAYFYIISGLLRRYFQNDLRPGAYVSGLIRIVTVLILTAAVDQMWEEYTGATSSQPAPGLNVTAFLIGVFPAVAMQMLRRSVAKVTGFHSSQGLQPSFPLRQLDGVDVWTETRLLEVGIEDVQHIASANLVDVILGTNISADRIVSWVDEALLLIHAGQPRENNAKPGCPYQQLRSIGVRSATDLLAFVEQWNLGATPAEFWPTGENSSAKALAEALGGPTVLARAAVIARLLRNDPNLRLVLHWQFYEQNAQTATVPHDLLNAVVPATVRRPAANDASLAT
jgi:hypothetical protein